MPRGDLILLTGISGYLGAHVAHQLLYSGYRVRGTTRVSKVDFIQRLYKQYGNKAEIVGIDDLRHGDYSAALKDVKAVIHVASPLPGRSASNEEQIDTAVDGTVNILKQGEQAGITKFVLVSSNVTVSAMASDDPSPLLTDKDWFNITREQGSDPAASFFIPYAASKVFAEKAAWEFADKHPHVDITTVNPPFFVGPFAPEWAAEKPSSSAISTASFIYDLLRPSGPTMLAPATIDVRDVARGVVLGLTAPPTSEVGRKRILMGGEWFGSRLAVDYIAKVRPELKGRLSEAAKAAKPQERKSNIDNSRAKDVLGLAFTDWHITVLDAVDSLLSLEEEWKSQGWVPPN